MVLARRSAPNEDRVVCPCLLERLIGLFLMVNELTNSPVTVLDSADELMKVSFSRRAACGEWRAGELNVRSLLVARPELQVRAFAGMRGYPTVARSSAISLSVTGSSIVAGTL